MLTILDIFQFGPDIYALSNDFGDSLNFPLFITDRVKLWEETLIKEQLFYINITELSHKTCKGKEISLQVLQAVFSVAVLRERPHSCPT